MSVFGRRAQAQPEYLLYARVSDTTRETMLGAKVKPLTEDDLIDTSNCTYQSIYMPAVQEHFKAGLLLCQKGCAVEYSKIDRTDDTGRTMFLIPCEAGLEHITSTSGPDMRWRWSNKVTPAVYTYLRWNTDELFNTALGKSIQLKVVDAREPDLEHQKPDMKRARESTLSNGGTLTDMKTLLNEIQLTSNTV